MSSMTGSPDTPCTPPDGLDAALEVLEHPIFDKHPAVRSQLASALCRVQQQNESQLAIMTEAATTAQQQAAQARQAAEAAAAAGMNQPQTSAYPIFDIYTLAAAQLSSILHLTVSPQPLLRLPEDKLLELTEVLLLSPTPKDHAAWVVAALQRCTNTPSTVKVVRALTIHTLAATSCVEQSLLQHVYSSNNSSSSIRQLVHAARLIAQLPACMRTEWMQWGAGCSTAEHVSRLIGWAPRLLAHAASADEYAGTASSTVSAPTTTATALLPPPALPGSATYTTPAAAAALVAAAFAASQLPEADGDWEREALWDDEVDSEQEEEEELDGEPLTFNPSSSIMRSAGQAEYCDRTAQSYSYSYSYTYSCRPPAPPCPPAAPSAPSVPAATSKPAQPSPSTESTSTGGWVIGAAWNSTRAQHAGPGSLSAAAHSRASGSAAAALPRSSSGSSSNGASSSDSSTPNDVFSSSTTGSSNLLADAPVKAATSAAVSLEAATDASASGDVSHERPNNSENGSSNNSRQHPVQPTVSGVQGDAASTSDFDDGSCKVQLPSCFPGIKQAAASAASKLQAIWGKLRRKMSRNASVI